MSTGPTRDNWAHRRQLNRNNFMDQQHLMALPYVSREFIPCAHTIEPGENKSAIEDCFAADTQNLKLGGKTFNRDNKADSSQYFGKHVLSQHVGTMPRKWNFLASRAYLTGLPRQLRRTRPRRPHFPPKAVTSQFLFHDHKSYRLELCRYKAEFFSWSIHGPIRVSEGYFGRFR